MQYTPLRPPDTSRQPHKPVQLATAGPRGYMQLLSLLHNLLILTTNGLKSRESPRQDTKYEHAGLRTWLQSQQLQAGRINKTIYSAALELQENTLQQHSCVG